MRKNPLRRPSPALVVACLALGFALGGTSIAAVSQLGRNTVGTPQLRNGAVTTPKLRNASVTSAKVANRSLRRVDFAPGQLTAGPTGPAGPAGPTGPAGAPGVSQAERVERTTVNNSLNTKTSVIQCPEGKRLLGGGARVVQPAAAMVAITQSYPSDDNFFNASAREVIATNASWSLTVFAVCAVVS